MAGGVEGSQHAPLRAALAAPSVELAGAALCLATLGAAACGALTAGQQLGDGPLPCPFREVTGLPCPFCGMTHSLLALGGGDLRESVHLNPLGPAALVLALVALLPLARAALAGSRLRLPRAALVLGLATLAAAWTLQLAGGLA